MPIGDKLRELFDGDDDDDEGMTELEHAQLHADDPEERDTPATERAHPKTTPDEGVS